ncbi:MAG: MFS transporter [Candidatus Rokubacteria bacterium]|nr:MFS transporter [Candidatus Rokubacteria bacterium]
MGSNVTAPKSGAAETEAAGRRDYLLLAGLTAGHLVNDFYAMVIPPLVPALRLAFDLGYFQIGLLAWCFYILSGLLQPTVGQLADSRGMARRVILSGFLVFALGFVAMGLAPTYPLLLVASLVCGVGATTFHPQSTSFLTRAFPASKGRAMGIHGWGGSVGNFLAPVVVAFLVTRWGWREALVWLAVPGVAAALLLRGLLDEPPAARASGASGGITRQLVLVSLAFGLLSMVLRGFLTFLPAFLVERGSSVAEAGVGTSLTLVVGLVAQPLGGQVYDRVGGRAVFLACSVGAGIGLVLFTLSEGVVLALGAAVVAFSVFALFPVALALGSEIAKGDRVGMSVGFVFGVSATLAAFTPILTGYVADRAGLGVAFHLLVVFAAGAAVMSAGLPGRKLAAAAPVQTLFPSPPPGERAG